MGFIFILPLAALFLWILLSTFRQLRRLNSPQSLWNKAWALLALGAGLGVWFALFMDYYPSPSTRLEGFPIPVGIHRFLDGKWTDMALPKAVRIAGFLANLLSGPAIAWLPMKLACVAKEFRLQNEQAGQRPPEA